MGKTARGLFLSALLLLAGSALVSAATITVTSLLDGNPQNDGVCTLREAIISANTNPVPAPPAGECANGTAGADTINFAIPSAGLHTIILFSSGLPAITESVTIDGFTQPGSSANTNATGALNAVYTVAIDGSGAGGTSAIFTIIGGSSTIRGLVVNRGALQGQSGFSIGSSGNHIEGNYIGPDATGTLANFPNQNGVLVVGGTGNVIGGTTPAARNLISANAFDNITLSSPSSGTIVQGNLIGTNAAGTAALVVANSASGIDISSSPNNTIGGTAAGAGNVVSGHQNYGIALSGTASTGNVIQGNRIGTNAAGTAALANGISGITIRNAAHNTTIGGTTAAARNLISGNTLDGITIADVGTDGNVIQGNFIGTDVTGTAALGNGQFGILPAFSSSNTIGGTAAGAGNVIAFNANDGVAIGGTFSNVQNAILGNSIFSNGGFGISISGNTPTANDHCDGDTGGNQRQNFPVLTSVTNAGVGMTNFIGTLDSTASSGPYRIEFFASPTCNAAPTNDFGEGMTFLGSTTVSTGASCIGAFNVTLAVAVANGTIVTATATDPGNNTSEFSQCFTAGVTVPPTATPTLTPSITPGGPTLTPTFTPSSTPTSTFTPTLTPTPTVTPTITNTPAGVPTSTPTPTPTTPPPTFTFTPTITPGGPTLTPTFTPTFTSTPTLTSTPTATLTPTVTVTPGGPTLTPTPTATITNTPAGVPTSTATATATSIPPTPTNTVGTGPGGPPLGSIPTLSGGMLAVLALALAGLALYLMRRP